MNAALRILTWLLALALVVMPVVAVMNGWIGAERWPLTKLRAHGEVVRGEATQLRAVVLPFAKPGFFAVRLQDAKNAVEKLPWVEHAEVRKRWPDVIEIEVAEHKPFARWGKDRLLSEHGKLFSANGVQVRAGLPLLDGPDTQVADVVALYNQARERLANAGGVRGAGMDKRGSWSITLSDGTEVVLGRNDPEQRLERFAPLLPRLAAQHPGQRLVRADLRYTNGFSLSWAALPKAAALPAPLGDSTLPLPAPDVPAGRNDRPKTT